LMAGGKELTRGGDGVRGLGGAHVPGEPAAQAAAHNPRLVVLRQPRQFLGEEGYRFTPRARKTRPVGAPEHAFRSKGVIYATDMRVKVAKRIRHDRMTRKRGRFDCDVREAGKTADVGEFDERQMPACMHAEREVIQHKLQTWM